MTNRSRFAGLAALAPLGGLLVALAAAPAQADAILDLSDGTNSISLSDHGTGVISYLGSLDNWQLDFALALTEPSLGTIQQPDMHLTGAMLGLGTLNFSFTDDSFVGSGEKGFFSGVAFNLGSGATLSGGTLLLDGSGNPIAPLASFGPVSGIGSGTQLTAATVNGSYGLEMFGTLTQTQLAGSSFDANLVPEPSTFALFGAGLLAFGLLIGRRRCRA